MALEPWQMRKSLAYESIRQQEEAKLAALGINR
jgi:hypothetical protein